MAPGEVMIALDEREAFDAILNEHRDSVYSQYLAYAMGLRYGGQLKYMQMAAEMNYVPYIQEQAYYRWLDRAEKNQLKEIAERALAAFPRARR